ncbi:unnamed protein product [Periconia digitata]|uniref:Uncharacterized protein n=1 Tax=Periconia digitata TaxID=1303443 RepID=A0A9W4UA00_9PLEO|nr:unnamed protein product [Periconia digitata]
MYPMLPPCITQHNHACHVPPRRVCTALSPGYPIRHHPGALLHVLYCTTTPHPLPRDDGNHDDDDDARLPSSTQLPALQSPSHAGTRPSPLLLTLPLLSLSCVCVCNGWAALALALANFRVFLGS